MTLWKWSYLLYSDSISERITEDEFPLYFPLFEISWSFFLSWGDILIVNISVLDVVGSLLIFLFIYKYAVNTKNLSNFKKTSYDVPAIRYATRFSMSGLHLKCCFWGHFVRIGPVVFDPCDDFLGFLRPFPGTRLT